MAEQLRRGDLLRHQVRVLPPQEAAAQVARERLNTITSQLKQFDASRVLTRTFEEVASVGKRSALVPELFRQEPSVPAPVDGEDGVFHLHPDSTVRSGIGWDFKSLGNFQVEYEGIRVVAHPGFILVQGANIAIIDPKVISDYRTIAGQTSPEMNPFAVAVAYSVAHPGTFKVPQLTLSDAANSLVRVDFGD